MKVLHAVITVIGTFAVMGFLFGALPLWLAEHDLLAAGALVCAGLFVLLVGVCGVLVLMDE